MKLDGTLVWSKAFLGDVTSTVNQVLVDSNDDLIVGAAFLDIPNRSNIGVTFQLYLLKINIENGELLDSFIDRNLTASPSAIIQDKNDKGFIIGSDNIIVSERGQVTTTPRILKISNDFEQIHWETDISARPYTYPWHIAEIVHTEDGNFIGIGRSPNEIESNDPSFPARILKFSDTGEIIWDKFIKSDDGAFLNNWLTDVAPYKNGFAACGVVFGHARENLGSLQQGWFITFDQEGNLDFISSTQELDPEHGTFSIYPNPAKDFINIEISDSQLDKLGISFYSVTGQLVFETNKTPVGKSNLLNLDNIDTGLYFIVLNSESGTYSQKVYIDKE